MHSAKVRVNVNAAVRARPFRAKMPVKYFPITRATQLVILISGFTTTTVVALYAALLVAYIDTQFRMGVGDLMDRYSDLVIYFV